MTNQAYSGHGSHQLIADFIINGKTGTIIFQPEGRKLFFEKGSLIFADSDNKSEKFQAIMVDSGLIDGETLERVKSALKKGESLGKRLKQEGLVDSKQLAGSLKQQITVVVEEVFKRAEGSYRVLNVLPAKVPHLKIQTMALVVRSLARLENYDYHEDHTRFSKSDHFEDRLSQLDFPDSQTRLLDHIRKQDHCSAEELSDHFKIDPKVTHGLLYTLELLGMLEPAIAEDQDDDDDNDDLLIVEEEEDDLNLEDGDDIKTQPSITPETIAASAGVAGLAVAARAAAEMDNGNEEDDEEELTIIDDDEDSPVDEDDTIHVSEDEEDQNFTNDGEENDETLTMVDQDDETLTMVDGDEDDDQEALTQPEEAQDEEESTPSYEENTLPGVHEPSDLSEPDTSLLLDEEEVSLEVDDDEPQEDPIDPSEQSGDALADILPEGNTEPGEVAQDDEDPVLESAEDTFENELPSEAERHAQSDQSDPHDINTDNYLASPDDEEEDEDELLASPEQAPDSAIKETTENLKTVAIPNAKERLDQHLAEMATEESHAVSQDQGSVQSLNEALNEMSEAEDPVDEDFDKAGAGLDDDDDIDAPEPSQDPNATLAAPPEASFRDDGFDIPRREPPKWDDEDLNSPITAGAYEETGETTLPEEPSYTPPKRKPMWLLVGILIVAVLGALSLFIPLPIEEEAPTTASDTVSTSAPQMDHQPEPAATQSPAEPDASQTQSAADTEQPKDETETQDVPEPEPTALATSPTPDPEPQIEPEPVTATEEEEATAVTEDPAPMTAEVSVPQRAQGINTADLKALTEDAVSRLRQSEGRYSVALLVACQQETIDKIMAKHGSDQIFVFPRSISGRSCYMVTWGLYTSRKAALTARDADVPDSLYNPEDPGWVVNLDSYRE